MPRRKGSKNKKNHYFDNAHVEALLVEYQRGGCTDIDLRNEIMGHADKLIHFVMLTNRIHTLYPRRDAGAEQDLKSHAWTEIERSLYKFQSGRSKCFNLWTQVAYQSMLALVKREGRDRLHRDKLKEHKRSKLRKAVSFDRFLGDARKMFRDDPTGIEILDALARLQLEDDNLHRGLLLKLVNESGHTRVEVKRFLETLVIMRSRFQDVPGDEPPEPGRPVRVTEIEWDS